MRHSKAVDLMDPMEALAGAVAVAVSGVQALGTSETGTYSFDNADGTSTVIGAATGDVTLATHVGDTTPPPVPTGIAATSVDGTVAVTWDGTLAGDVPADFLRVNLYVDGEWFAALTEAGSCLTPPQAVGSTVSVTATSEDDACLFDGTPAHNVSDHCAPVEVVVRDLFAEGRADIEGVRAEAAELRATRPTKVEVSTAIDEAKGDIIATIDGEFVSDDQLKTLATKTELAAGIDGLRTEVSEGYVDKATGEALATKTEVKQATDAIALTAQSALAKVDGLKVGGTNLATGSKDFTAMCAPKGGLSPADSTAVPGFKSLNVPRPATGSFDPINFKLDIPAPKKGDVLTVSFDAKAVTAGGDIMCYCWADGTGLDSVAKTVVNSDGVKSTKPDGANSFHVGSSKVRRYWYTVTYDADAVTAPQILIGRIRSDCAATSVSLLRIKVELGNAPTDWGPAPEDAEATYATKAALKVESDRITGVVSEQAGLAERASALEQTSEGLKVTMTETAKKADDAKEAAEGAADTANSAMDLAKSSQDIANQGAEATAGSIAALNESVAENNNILAELQASGIADLSAMVRIVQQGGVPLLQLGSSTSDMWVQLSNSQLTFMDGDAAVAYVSGMRLYISQAEVTGSLGVGNFALMPRSNGNLCLKKVR